MYDNIGGKIKGLAKATFIIGIIGAIIVGIVMMVSSDEILIFLGLVVMFIAPVIVWISSLFLYGFGELIDKVSDIERNTRGGERKSLKQDKVDSERIQKIEKLRSQGLITEEEYQQAISKE